MRENVSTKIKNGRKTYIKFLFKLSLSFIYLYVYLKRGDLIFVIIFFFYAGSFEVEREKIQSTYHYSLGL